MVNMQTLQGNWTELKGRLRERWGQLTGEDLQKFQGNYEELVGLIQRKTGEGRDQIEQYLDQITSGAAEGYGRVAERGREYAHQASEAFQQGYDEAARQFRARYSDAEDLVRQHPGQSVAAVFGIGLLAGLCFALFTRSR